MNTEWILKAVETIKEGIADKLTNDRAEISDMMYDLLGKRKEKKFSEPFSEDERKMITDIAAKCRETQLYKENIDKSASLRTMTSEEIYRHIITNIAETPIPILAVSVAILCMPILDDKLKEEEVSHEEL